MNADAVRPTENPWAWTLCAILACSLFLRLWGVNYGLPLSYWQDEYHELMRAMQLGAGSVNLARTTKGGFYLLLFFEYGVYYLVLKLSGVVTSTQHFAELFARDPSSFYLIGRATAALLGCLTVAATYWIARFAFTKLAAIVAAVLLAVNVLHVDLSHRIGVDVPMAACAALAIYFGLKLAEDGARRNYILAALFAALATTTKLPGILVLIPLLIAHWYATSSGQGGARGIVWSRDLWSALGIFAAILVATNPGILSHAGLGAFMDRSGGPADLEDSDDRTAAFLGSRPNLFLYYLGVLVDSMGWPLFIVSLVALAWAVQRRTRADVMLLSYALANYLAISSTASQWLYYPRYALPIIIVMLILVGRLVSDVVENVRRWRAAVGMIALVLLAAWPAWRVVVADYSLTLTDTRTVAKEWFESTVPAGARVLVEGGKTGPKRETVQIGESRASLERRIAYWRKVEPRQARFLEVKLAIDDGSGYDLELVRQQSIKSLDDYLAAGVEYFILRPEYFETSRKAGVGAIRLLQDLRKDPRVKLVRRFVPESSLQLGDTVEIYRLVR